MRRKSVPGNDCARRRISNSNGYKRPKLRWKVGAGASSISRVKCPRLMKIATATRRNNHRHKEMSNTGAHTTFQLLLTIIPRQTTLRVQM